MCAFWSDAHKSDNIFFKLGSAGHFLAQFSAPCMRCCVAQSVSRHARPLPRRVARGFTSRRSLVAWMRRRFWWRLERIGGEKIWCGFVYGERCPDNTTSTVDGMKDNADGRCMCPMPFLRGRGLPSMWRGCTTRMTVQLISDTCVVCGVARLTIRHAHRWFVFPLHSIQASPWQCIAAS
jgi:hypothetical protein